ncbi:MAG: hypothetical protein AAF471_05205 [Myxococcota bacterium]
MNGLEKACDPLPTPPLPVSLLGMKYRGIGCCLYLAFLLQACSLGKVELAGSLQGHAFRPTKTVFAYEEAREDEGGEAGGQRWLVVFMSSFGFDAKRNFAEAKQARLEQLRQGMADSDVLIFRLRLPRQPNGRRFVSATHPDRWEKLSSSEQAENSESVGEMRHRVQMRVRGNQSTPLTPPTMLSARIWSYSPTGDAKHRFVTGGVELEVIQRGPWRASLAPDPAKRVVTGSFEAPFIDPETAKSNLKLLLVPSEQEGEGEPDGGEEGETESAPTGEGPESEANNQESRQKPSDLL